MPNEINESTSLLMDARLIAKDAIEYEESKGKKSTLKTKKECYEALIRLAMAICALDDRIRQEGLLPKDWEDAVHNRNINQLRQMASRNKG